MEEQVQAAVLSLKRSAFRSQFKLSATDPQYLHDKGIETIRRHAFDLITARIAPAFPENDGKQTPMKNHPLASDSERESITSSGNRLYC
jgi:hypothetical protein